MHTARIRRRAALAFVVLCVVVLGGALAWAPYLPRLAFEGYPQATWPAPGAYTAVPGAGEQPTGIPTDTAGAEFEPTGRRMFEEKEGRALLVFQGGRLRFEHYAAGVGPETRLNAYSMVKSLVGALVLRAHAEGRIARLEDPIGVYLPGLGDAAFRAVPIAEFLRMRSGVVFEPAGPKTALGGNGKDIEKTRLNPFGPMVRLHMLGLESIGGTLTSAPSARGRYDYQNVNTAILGRLLETVYGRPLEQVLGEQIWKPAGAATAQWRRAGPDRSVSAYCCLYATPRDWLRVGVFLMNNGTRDRPFLPWLLWSRFLGLDLPDDDVRDGRYGLHIYQNMLDRAGEPLQGPFAYMFGSRGQVVYLMPRRDLVVVRFGAKIPLLHSTLYAAWRSIGR